MKRLLSLLVLTFAFSVSAGAQIRYFNPVLHLDYSDPDVCRVGEDYYMTASSFNCFPGLPILHSRDLVNWTPVGAALTGYEEDFLTSVQHANGVWAPSIRYHDGWFYIFCGDPDRGIFMVRTQDPRGRWEDPVWVVRAKGFIDPCPLWDEDGRAWLSHAAAGSRAGLKSVVFVAPMCPDGTRLLGPSRIVYDGHRTQPTIEGTKFYKRNGYYYIFAPAGGVKTGWQTVLRSRHPLGPYEERIVMASAPGTINGPHQGGWVETPSGESWFLHFQDKGAYGRIVHLQPMTWLDDGWPLIGEDPDGDGVGQPVRSWRAPYGIPNAVPTAAGALTGSDVMPGSDRASTGPYGLPLDWQYPAVPSPYWHYALPEGGIRLYSVEQAHKWPDWRQMKNLLLRKFPAERFFVAAKLVFHPNPQLDERQESAGFLVSGDELAGFNLESAGEGARLHFFVSRPEDGKVVDEVEEETAWIPYDGNREATLWVRLEVRAKNPATTSSDVVTIPVPDAICRFFYSLDGKQYAEAGVPFTARPEQWIGSKFGFFCNRYAPKNDAGWLDILDLRVVPEYDPLEGFNYDEAKVPEYELPELLRLSNGKPVKDVGTWEKLRRPELLKLFEEQMYGIAPETPAALHFRLLSEDPSAFDGLATRKEVKVCFDEAETEYLTLLLYIPNMQPGSSLKRRAPAPCFLGINFFGNHTTSTDPGVSMPDISRYRTDFKRDPRGSQSQRWPIETILGRGYAVATFCCEDVDPDVDDGFRNGVHGLLGPKPHSDSDWGTLAAWAWGLSRALDYLQKDPDIAGDRVAVFGHSRMGKAALWAGARDLRFAMVISNASGCGGAAISRRRYGETLRRINIRFPHWYCGNFHRYGDNESEMPFDQHELLALIAPRPLYIESGSEDRWSDPYGEYLSLIAASPVYRLYGFDTFTDPQLPPVETPQTKGRTGHHIRAGKHEILLYDWQQYLDFADRLL